MAYKIITVGIDQLTPHPKNPNKHTSLNIQEITASIEQFGYIDPIICRKLEKDSYQILAGEGRWIALKSMGKTTAPIIVAELSEAQGLQYMIASNEIPRSSELDPAVFAQNLQEIADLDPSFNWTSIGLSDADARTLLEFNGQVTNDGSPENMEEGFDDQKKPVKPVKLSEEQREYFDSVVDKFRSIEQNDKIPEGVILVALALSWMSEVTGEK